MADINKALPLLFEVEFNNNPEKFLHKNRGEDGFTLGGVYQKSNPYKIDWNFIDKIFKACDKSIVRASKMLYYDNKTQNEVRFVFKDKYWDKLKLDRVVSQDIANNIFLFGVLAGVSKGAKIAQRIIGTKDDGIIGNKSLASLNVQDPKRFNKLFDNMEKEYFRELVANNDKYAKFLNGWKKRAEFC